VPRKIRERGEGGGSVRAVVMAGEAVERTMVKVVVRAVGRKVGGAVVMAAAGAWGAWVAGGGALARRVEMAAVRMAVVRAVCVAAAVWAAGASGIDPREGGRIASQQGKGNQVRNQGRGHGGMNRISHKEGGGEEIHAQGQSRVQGFQYQRRRVRGTILRRDARAHHGEGSGKGKDHVRGSGAKWYGKRGGTRRSRGKERGR